MKKLTAEKCRERIASLKRNRRVFGLAMDSELYLKALEIALPVLEQESQSCTWKYDESDYYWSSACGEDWCFTDGGPEENRVKFCQGCGRPVVLEQQEREGGEEE